jgi:hypothetical protein
MLIPGNTMFIEEMKEGLNIMLHPGSATKKTVGIGEGFRFYYKMALIPLIVSVIIGIIVAMTVHTPPTPQVSTNPFASMFSLQAVSGIGIIGGSIAALLVGVPISMLISAAILQLFGKHLFKVYKNDYEHTFTAYVKGSAVPGTLFYWLSVIPVIGSFLSIIFSVWGLIVAIIALANQQGITRWKSLGVLVATVVIVGIIFGLVAVGIAAAFIKPY